MATSPNLPPWFETARIAAKCTQAAPAVARLLTMRPSVLSSCQVAKIERFTASQVEAPIQPRFIRRHGEIGKAPIATVRRSQPGRAFIRILELEQVARTYF
jgi:hypothetical protein